jgi:type II secretory ATPase GspE/PulE/Tfp pilus assembly ATPase PilB-like protein
MFGRDKQAAGDNTPPNEIGPEVDFKAKGGANKQENEANAIQARQSPGIIPTKMLIAQAVQRGASRILLDYTAQGVTVKLDVDGFWHDLPQMDRATGDVMLAVMKKMANLDPAERRERQVGDFSAVYRQKARNCHITSQGVPTGERAMLRVVDPKEEQLSLEEMGMRENIAGDFKHRVGRAMGEVVPPPPLGLYVFSAPANGGGLSSLWVAGLSATDRYMRDFIGLEEVTRREPEVENIEVVEYEESAGESANDLIPQQLRRQPDVFTVPLVADKQTLDTLCEMIESESMAIFTSVRAKSAAEALCKLHAAAGSKSMFLQSINLVINMRLVRKLCENCKVPFQPHPQVVQRLGLPPERVDVLYQEWQPPPPDPDAKNQEPPPICPECGGIGYRGRTGMFEVLIVDDNIRKAMAANPDAATIQQLAQNAGMKLIRDEGVLLLAQGITSIPELQRALQ